MLSNRIGLLHYEKGKTIIADAVAIGVNVKTMYRCMDRTTEAPRAGTLAKMAEYYDVSVDYLLGISDVRRKYGE